MKHKKKLKTIDPVSNQPVVKITRSGKPLKEDVRLASILQNIDEIAYYDLDEVCDEIEAFKAYLRERPLTLLERGKNLFLIDEEALSHLIYLNCFECTKIHQYGCCCGSPCDMSDKNKRVFKRHEKKIGEALKLLNEKDYKKVIAEGGFLNKDGSINAYEGRCAMLVEDEGVYKCITHKYARDTDVPIYDLCPLSCLMYPLEIIELVANYKTRAILLTAAVEENFAKNFSRWGSYGELEVELRCLDHKAHDDVFKELAYKPVYEVNKGLITHEFGGNIYTALQSIFQTR